LERLVYQHNFGILSSIYQANGIRMPNTDDLFADLRETLRSQFEAARTEYDACIQAVDVLEAGFKNLKMMTAGLKNQGAQVRTALASATEAASPPARTNRQLVIDALTRKPGATMDELERETGLTKTQLKSAIYAQDSRDLFVSQKKGYGGAKYYLRDSDMK
jgi:hypothetical protein